MYMPASFAETDQQKLHDFIESHSFATLVSDRNGKPFASHLPLLLDRQAGQRGQLIGHMAKANPQWQDLEGRHALAIFGGPHAYISPNWYHARPVVPTWNYVAVHASGIVRLEQDAAPLLSIVRRYVDFYERNLPAPWSLDTVESGFVEQLLEAIVGFTIQIESLEGKWKLGQNHPAERRRNVVEALRETSDEGSRQIADLMEQTLEEGGSERTGK